MNIPYNKEKEMFKMGRGNKQYDPAYKAEICQALENKTATVAGMSRETGIPENTLRMWKRRYRDQKDKAFVGSGHILPENEELVRLRRENRDLREDNEILKKAAAYFAKHQQ
jgi:transposase